MKKTNRKRDIFSHNLSDLTFFFVDLLSFIHSFVRFAYEIHFARSNSYQAAVCTLSERLEKCIYKCAMAICGCTTVANMRCHADVCVLVCVCWRSVGRYANARASTLLFIAYSTVCLCVYAMRCGC